MWDSKACIGMVGLCTRITLSRFNFRVDILRLVIFKRRGGYEFVFFCLGMVEICSVGLGGLLFRISM